MSAQRHGKQHEMSGPRTGATAIAVVIAVGLAMSCKGEMLAAMSGRSGSPNTAAGVPGGTLGGSSSQPPGGGASLPGANPLDSGAPAGQLVTFTKVFDEALPQGGCGATWCHGAGAGGLTIDDNATSLYEALVNKLPSSTGPCAQSGLKLVEPGSPERSLLWLKLNNTQPCGLPMPPEGSGQPLLAAQYRELVQAWIVSGALPPAPSVGPGDGSTGGEQSGTSGNVAGAGGEALGGAGSGGGSVVPAEQQWTTYGYDQANTRFNRSENKISPANVAMLKPKWSNLQLSGGMDAVPAVVGGVVYITDYTKSIRAFDANNGKQKWAASIASTFNQWHGSPLVDGKLVYVAGGGTLGAWDKDTGAVAWTRVLSSHASAHIFGSPALADDFIVIGVAGHELVNPGNYTFVGTVQAIDKKTGVVAWSTPMAGPTIAAGVGVSVWSSPAIDTQRKMAFIGTGQAYTAPASPRSDSLVALDYTNGSVKWVHQFTANDIFTLGGGGGGPDHDVGASPNLLVSQGKNAVSVGSKAGVFKVLERDTGNVIWQKMLTKGSAEGGVMTSAAIGDGVIYALSNTWTVWGFTRGGGTTRYDPGDTSTLFALNADDGTEIWKVQLPQPGAGHLALANGLVYAALFNGRVYAIDAAKGGTPLWEYDMGKDQATGISISNGVVYGGAGGRWMKDPPADRRGGSLFAFSVD